MSLYNKENNLMIFAHSDLDVFWDIHNLIKNCSQLVLNLKTDPLTLLPQIEQTVGSQIFDVS